MHDIVDNIVNLGIVCMKIKLLFISLLLVFLTITGCESNSPPSNLLSVAAPWKYTDLRTVDPADAPESHQDLVAVYARGNRREIQLRLDLIEVTTYPVPDIILVIDSAPGGKKSLPGKGSAEIAWDTLIHLRANGEIWTQDADLEDILDFPVVAIRKLDLDTIEIQLDRRRLPGNQPNPRFQVFTMNAETNQIVDRVAPTALYERPPEKAPVLLAFSNTLPAFSAGQSLRRWQGAHTGPLGGRHGLGFLLKAIQDYRMPAVLLDLKALPALAALDYLDRDPLIGELVRAGLIILPDSLPITPGAAPPALPDWMLTRAADDSRKLGTAYGLPGSPFLYTQTITNIPAGYPVVFTYSPGNGNVSALESPEVLDWQHTIPVRQAGIIVLPIPGGNYPQQATASGPSLELRQALANTAAAPSPKPWLVLGGDLPTSTWGDPQYAAVTLRYLRSRPWIEVLDEYHIRAAKPVTPLEKLPNLQASPPSPTLQTLIAAFDEQWDDSSNILVGNAWQALLSLYAPTSPAPAELADLRAGYLGQIHVLLEAAKWAGKPAPYAGCSTDPDLDEQPECILASDDIYSIFEMDTGALVYAFGLTQGIAHQIIAPSSQFAVGQSEANRWLPGTGIEADPGVIPGGFSDEGPFEAIIQPGRLEFVGTDVVKSYTLIPAGVHVSYQASSPKSIRIPLGVDSWERFSPGWEERYDQDSGETYYRWGIPGTAWVSIITSAHLNTSAFTDSRQDVQLPENPNIDYPQGHHLAFPLALVEVIGVSELEMEILLSR